MENIDNDYNYLYSSSKRTFALVPANYKKKNLKINYLQSIGFFNEINFKQLNSGRLNKQDIESALANTLQITFEVTEKCNLACKYCGYGELYTGKSFVREGRDLPEVYAKKLLDFLFKLFNSEKNKSINKKVAISFYGGEPLLNIKFIKNIINYIKKFDLKNIVPFYTMTTNALLLKKNIQFLIENDFHILISLDGNKENNSYRTYKNQTDAFEEIINNIDFVYSNYPKYFSSNVGFNTVLHNKNSVDEAVKFIHTRYKKDTTLTELNTIGIPENKKEEFWKKYRNAFESLNQSEDYRFIRDTLFVNSPDIAAITSFIHNYYNGIYKTYKDFFEIFENQNILPTGTCIPFSRKIFLTTQGIILPCERIPHNLIFGSVNEHSVNIEFENIINTINNIYNLLSEKYCNKCYNSGICIQCIFNLDIIEIENLHCPGFKNRKKYEKFINLCINLLKNDPLIFKKIIKNVFYE